MEMYETRAGRDLRLKREAEQQKREKAKELEGWFKGWDVIDTEVIPGVVYEAIKAWLKVNGNLQRIVSASTLYEEVQELRWPTPEVPAHDWPKSVNWFGRNLTEIRKRLEIRHGFESWRTNQAQVYLFYY